MSIIAVGHLHAIRELGRHNAAARAGSSSRLIRLIMPIFVVSFATLATSALANDLCTTVGTTTTCSGDQSAGIAFNPNNGTTSLWVQSLTLPIAPPAGTSGINFQSLGANGVTGPSPNGQAGSDLSTTTDKSVSISTTDGAPGILVTSTGGNGADALTIAGITVFTGGAGAQGGAITVGNGGSITTAGTNAFGISAQSIGGTAGLNAITGGGGLGGVVTVTNSGSVATNGTNAFGIFALSTGGNGFLGSQDNGAPGASSGNISVTNSGSITTQLAGSAGIFASSLGGTTRNSSTDGASAGSITISNTGTITTSGSTSIPILPLPSTFANGITALGTGGAGSDGKNENRAPSASGGNAGIGGVGSAISVTSSGTITANGLGSFGIYLQSQGGAGGTGGAAGVRGAIDAGGGDGGTGGAGGGVTVTASGTMMSSGGGISANSVGGVGGNGGSATGLGSTGRPGGDGGAGGDVTITATNLSLSTTGTASVGSIFLTNAPYIGILALSQGGKGGNGGDASDGATVNGTSGNGGGGGTGGNVTMSGSGSVSTAGAGAVGIFGQSLGGNGGNGAAAFGFTNADARNGGAGGDGGTVNINTSVNVTTSGSGAHGIATLSQGGNSGNGGSAQGASANGGNSATAGSGGIINLTSNGRVTTGGATAAGLFALSAGGTGGNGNSAEGLVALGGLGGNGGDGGAVTITANGTVSTAGSSSAGISAQSTGGVGGNGASAGAAGGSGGAGGNGGAGSAVIVNANGKITTGGELANGVFALSGGGAGGTGGSATGAVVTNGGSGGTGGAGGAVTVTTASNSTISTSGALATGVFARSLGAAGGNGGNSGAAVNTPGGGGAGGISDVVTVTANGAITTSGFGAFGIQAESTGGGGGTAANGSGIVSVGGTGGAASSGGFVNVTNNGSIATSGLFAHGIAAGSIGGGGGAGSQANDLVALGGSGNSSGDGNSVTITNGVSGTIQTSGLGAYGIYAESVGGGGGNGGGAKGLVSIGGAGSTGGNGGQVNVINNGLIATSGIGGNGIFAQSVGGGGGDGGSASSFAALASVAIGGSGGVAGSGSLVLVDNTGTIQVSGFRSSAIFAQSLGGGGGNGGDGTLDCGCVVQYAVGGKGGSSGTGGDVRVFNSGTISSTSDLAPAIFAQSVGGGGGSGGAGYGFGAGLFNVGISVGGAGGSAGGGGTVTVNQSGAIVTTGINSNGITAYSIGGGGGFGGSSASRTASAIFGGGNIGSSGSSGGTPPGTGSGPSTFGLDFSFGGSGGAAGDGGAVNVSNTGFIVTGGAASSGIFAQSVGGGGGNGGDASATSTAVNEGTASTISLALSIGGQGGAGGKGGTVTVNNVGKIFTVGDLAPAIVAQSVGGGGGMGGAGTASSDTVGNINNFLPGNIVNPNPSTPPSDPGVPNSTDRSKLEQLANGTKEGTKISIAVGIGGNGGTANDGGDVHVTNDGSIVTFGFASQGIFAQSVGGGGGTAGGGGGQSSGGIAVGVGKAGSGGGGGKGGDIFVTNTGIISTFGDDSTAIFAQSIGGGGGVAMVGDGHVGLNPKGIAIAIGGTTGSSGAGGNITVTQNGAITTIGDRAYGILAESIGGGGGVGGTGDGVNLGAVVVGGKGGAGGAGGTVQVTDTGGITTFGNGAYGIVAQSIGGGGGIGGDAAGSNPHLGSRAITVGVGVGGAAGEAGDGHAVTVSSTGSITTSGIAAYGILAQSLGGGGGFGGSGSASGGTIAFAGSNGGHGAGGTVTIDQTGNVITSGLDSHAIFAQSVGGNGGGNITVNIHGGMINGGTGSAAGIYLDGGNTNAITISSGAMVTAQSGFAIQATDGVDQNNVAKVIGNTTVNNSGGLVGNVDLGSGAGQVNNLAGGTFVTGSVLNLGSGAMVNSGRLDIGGIGSVATTSMTGNFLQTTAGTYVVDVRFGGKSDLLAVNGVANVRGAIEPHLQALLPNTPATILTATNGFVGINDVSAINSPTVTYGVQFVGNSLQLVALQAQLVSPAFAASLTPNELAVANQLQSIWNAGATPGIGPAFAALANLTDPQTYAQVMDRLHPGPYLAQAVISTFTGLGFVDSMLSCHFPTGPYAPLTEVPCDWAKLTGSFSSQGSSSSSTGFHDQAARLQVGRQVQLAPDWFGEFAFGYETGRTTSGTFATTSADRYDFGAALKHQIGPWLFAAALDAGYEHLNTTRDINFAGVTAASSAPSVWRLDSRFRAAYVVESNGLYVKPSLDLDAIYTAMPGFSEQGAGALGLNVAAANKITFAATPTIELGQTWLFSDGSALRPYVRGGATVFSNNTLSLNSTFEGAPAGVAPFTTLSSLPQTLWKVSAGIDIFGIARIPNLDLRLEYEGRFGASYNDQTGLVKLSRHF